MNERFFSRKEVSNIIGALATLGILSQRVEDAIQAAVRKTYDQYTASVSDLNMEAVTDDTTAVGRALAQLLITVAQEQANPKHR